MILRPLISALLGLYLALATTAVLLTSGGDAQGAAFAGGVSASAQENNYLRHDQWEEYLARLAACKDDARCTGQVHAWAETASLTNQHAFLMCRETGSCDAHYAAIEAAEAGG